MPELLPSCLSHVFVLLHNGLLCHALSVACWPHWWPDYQCPHWPCLCTVSADVAATVDIRYTTLSQNLILRTQGQQSAPIIRGQHQYFMAFTGCSLQEDVLKDWLRACTKQVTRGDGCWVGRPLLQSILQCFCVGTKLISCLMCFVCLSWQKPEKKKRLGISDLTQKEINNVHVSSQSDTLDLVT